MTRPPPGTRPILRLSSNVACGAGVGVGAAVGAGAGVGSAASTFLRVARFFGAGASVVTGSISAATAFVLAVLVAVFLTAAFFATAVFFTARLRAGAAASTGIGGWVSSDCFLLIRVEMGKWVVRGGFKKRVDRGFRRQPRSW